MTDKPDSLTGKLPRWLWVGLLLAALAFSPWLGGMLTGVGPAAARALIAAAGIAWVIDRRGSWSYPRPAAWLWIFIGWASLTVLRGTDVHASLTALSDLITWATILILCADGARDRKMRVEALGWLLVGFYVVSWLGMHDGLTNIPGWRIFGPFNNPNLFAAYLITLLPVLIVWCLAWSPRMARPVAIAGRWWDSARALAVIGLGSGLTALFMTGSKGALAALVFGIAAVLALGFWRRVRIGAVVFGIVLVIAAAVGGKTLLGRVETATTTQAHSSEFRVLTWKGAAGMAEANPVIGTGIGTFGSAFSRYAVAGWTGAAHNAYLQTAAETGLPGLILLLIPLGMSAALLWRAKRNANPWTALLAVAALAALIAAAAHNLVDYGWTVWAPSAVMWALVGLALGREERANRAMPPWAAWGMATLLGAVLLGGLLMANAASLADPATDPDSGLSPEERVAALESARRLSPLDADIARQLGIARARVGDGSGALDALLAATRLNAGQPTAWRYLGEGYEHANRTEDARAAFATGLKHAPNSMSLLLDAAQLADQTGRHADALNLYRRLIAVAEGPVGKYPATPEIVDTEPLYAYAAVAAEERRHGNDAAARRHLGALIALANRYEANRKQYPLIWQATGKDNAETLAEVQHLRAMARESLKDVKR